MNPKFAADNKPIKLYRNPKSGHCHRAELMLALLGIPYEPVDLDMANGAHKASDYLKISPLGQVPSIDDNGTILTDSNAILVYLVSKYSDDHEWMPSDPVKAAAVQRWLSIAAGEIAYGPCRARLVKVFGASHNWDLAKEIADKVFAVMETTLKDRDWLATDVMTVADVAAYSYTAHVQEGAISLADYPAIRAWLTRIEAHPRFVGMVRSPELV